MGTRIVHRLEYLNREGDVMTEALDNRKREEIVHYAALVTQVELLTGGELMHGCSRRLEQGGWGLKMEIEEQVRFFKQLDSLADLHGISVPSVCRVSRPDKPMCRASRQGADVGDTAESMKISVEVTPVTYGWMIEEPGSATKPTNAIGADTEQIRSVLQRPQTDASNPWMKKLAMEDRSGPEFPVGQYLQLRDKRVDGNPRQTSEYREKCLQAVGLGAEVDMARYGHLQLRGDFGDNVSALRWVVRRGTGCFWVPDSPRSSVRGFKHRLITRGPPVRIGLHRLNRPDTE